MASGRYIPEVVNCTARGPQGPRVYLVTTQKPWFNYYITITCNQSKFNKHCILGSHKMKGTAHALTCIDSLPTAIRREINQLGGKYI